MRVDRKCGAPVRWGLFLNFASAPSAATGLAASAEVGKDRYYQMSGKPDVVVTHVLINVDQYQNARHKNAQNDVCYLRDAVRRVEIWENEKIDEQHDAREEERKEKKVEVHG